VEATATERQILLSSSTYELVRHMTDMKFHACGKIALKGVDQTALWEADWDGNGPRPLLTQPTSLREAARTAVRHPFTGRLWMAPAVAVVLFFLALAMLNRERLRTVLPGGVPRIETLAVLPLENLSGDAAQDYLASGIHEALISDLAKLKGFRRVIARS